jgi:hypothetical protein
MYHAPSDYRYSIEGLQIYSNGKMFMYVSETVVIIKYMKHFQSFRYYFAAYNFVTIDSETKNFKTM